METTPVGKCSDPPQIKGDVFRSVLLENTISDRAILWNRDKDHSRFLII